ncbi:MAG: HEAT repeat domain-containing protein [Chloroflexi bacterium]|nr:HEAT repeat domain-containing protein [Chloroflexota bacterium]
MKRSIHWLLIGIAFISLLAIVYRLRTVRGRHVSHSKLSSLYSNNLRKTPSNPRPNTVVQLPTLSTKRDLKTVLKERISEIAAQLPDLDTVPLERALSYHFIAPRRRNKLLRNEQGQLIAVMSYEPTSWSEITFEVPPFVPYEPLPNDQGFHTISTIILEEIFQSTTKDNAEIAANLVSFLQCPDSDLGDSPDARKVLLAARWQAAIALRRVPITESQVTQLSAIASHHRDEVLRGAAAGAILANQGAPSFVSNWLASERTPRALQAFLVELIRRDRFVQFPPHSRPIVDREDDDYIEITHDGGIWTQEKPISGENLFDQLTLLLREGAGIPSTTEIKPALTRVREPGRVNCYRTPLENTKGFLIEAIRLRTDESRVPTLLQLVDLEIEPEYRARLITAIGEARAPNAYEPLTHLAAYSATLPERTAAINGIALFENHSSRSFLEALLWDEDSTIRAYAASGLYRGDHKRHLSEAAKHRIAELAQAATSRRPTSRDFYAEFVSWINWFEHQPR